MQRYSISQLPVVRDGELDSLADVIGSLHDRDLLDRVFKNSDALHESVGAAMQPPLAAIDADEKLDEVFSTLSGGRANAVVVAEGGKPIGVLTEPTCWSTWRTDGDRGNRPRRAASLCGPSCSTARQTASSRRSMGSGACRSTRSRPSRLPNTSSSGAGSARTTARS